MSKISEVLRDAAAQMREVGVICDGSDVILKEPDGADQYITVVAGVRNASRTAYEVYRSAHHRGFKLVERTPLDAIASMCVEGALWRAAGGDLSTYLAAADYVEYTVPAATLWYWNDHLVRDQAQGALDVVLNALEDAAQAAERNHE